MVNCTFYLRKRLGNYGYKTVHHMDNDLILKTGDGKRIWICYLTKEITSEEIRRSFDFDGHVLFIVNEKLIPDEIESREATPMWLRVLHGLYMGRVYVWNDRTLFGLHFDYDTGDVNESGVIQPDELLLIETGTWLRGWSGMYKLARFKDRQWWNEPSPDYRQQRTNQTQEEYNTRKKYENETGHSWWDQRADEKQSSSQQSARDAYEQARDHYWRKQKQREAEQEQRAREQQYQQQRERAQRQQYDSDGFSYDPADWPNGKPPPGPSKRDFLREFMTCANKAAAKSLFKKLAKEFHPDLNPGKDTTVEMQQINAAWDKAERMWR